MVLPEVLDIALSLPAPVLDFGCGSGALVNALRLRGKESVGLGIKDESFSRLVIARNETARPAL